MWAHPRTGLVGRRRNRLLHQPRCPGDPVRRAGRVGPAGARGAARPGGRDRLRAYAAVGAGARLGPSRALAALPCSGDQRRDRTPRARRRRGRCSCARSRAGAMSRSIPPREQEDLLLQGKRGPRPPAAPALPRAAHRHLGRHHGPDHLHAHARQAPHHRAAEADRRSQPRRSSGLILQQSLIMGALAYGVAYLVGQQLFPMFPRRVLVTERRPAPAGRDRAGDLGAGEPAGHLEGDARRPQRGDRLSCREEGLAAMA